MSKRAIKVVITPEHHAALVEAARGEGVPLNQYCIYILAVHLSGDITQGFDDLFAIQEREAEAVCPS